MNKIIDNTESLADFFDGLKSDKIKIPKYQRSYSWEKTHIDDLLNDLFFNQNASHLAKILK